MTDIKDFEIKDEERCYLKLYLPYSNRTFIFPDTKDTVMEDPEQRECAKEDCGRPFMVLKDSKETICPRCKEIANLKDNGC